MTCLSKCLILKFGNSLNAHLYEKRPNINHLETNLIYHLTAHLYEKHPNIFHIQTNIIHVYNLTAHLYEKHPYIYH
jgi:hypothetical protein